MTSSNPEASARPDLTQGVAVDEIPIDGVFAGLVGEDPVILARVDGAIVALDGACTHYSGALHDGLRTGHTINCPLHHACFDLRTGLALKAPALAPLNRWKVEAEGDRVFVREKLPAGGESLAPDRDASNDPKSIVIVGGGAASFAAAQRLRDLGFTGALTMLSADRDAPYDRPNVSKDYLSGDADPSWMPLKGEDFYREHDIILRTNTWVQAIDTTARVVTLQGGETLAYEALLLATGAEPNRPPGFDHDNVHLLRSLADGDRLITASKSAARVAVVGSSFIGLEAAASLRLRGLEVHVIGPDATPLESKLGAELGGLIKAAHDQHGVRFHLGRKVDSFDGERLTLDDGSVVETDLVVLGVGVKPRLELAQAAGLAMDRGVMVDAAMRTSDPHVFAAGDIARYPSPVGGPPIRVEHWVVAERQGQAAAAAMLGLETAGEPPYFWSAHYDLTIRYVGHAEDWHAIEVTGSVIDRDAEVAYLKDGRVVAVATVNRDLASLKAAQAFVAG
ncbi:FAD-dependent oxidoreductase [Caulobacter soli]|uniref:FAD-dependent oxidoreductase n=1 Tax=Caulobacter soli TaxID=2708539 RepID=UPI0013EBD99C|nr:FAD-dependent oxidoreductase [Caulobacter soli]